jgi:carbon-monoxide dehydrogenase large subunit
MADHTPVLGAPLRGREAPAQLRGQATYTGDVHPPGTVWMEILRSEHGHALIRGIDTGAAERMPGVLKIVTGADLEGRLMPLPCIWIPGGTESHFPPHPYGLPGAGTVLATDRVRYVGDPVAAVVAETREQARDAARAVVVDYEPLPVVRDPRAALAEGAPQLHDAVPQNLNARWTCGDDAATAAALDAAEVRVELEVHNQRTANSPIEPRAAVGSYDPATDEYTLWSSTQSPHNHRFLLAALVLGIPFTKLRVISSRVGGSFGTKGYLYADMPLVLLLSKDLGRPVKWTDTREGLLRSTVQGRDQHQFGTIAGTRDGRITALRCVSYANLGAYPSTIGPGVATALMGRSLTGPYAVEAAFCEVNAVFTNITPLGAQRGSGRAESTFLLERLVDRFAAEIGMDPAEVRRINLVRPEAMPYDNGLGWLYDSGDYPEALRKVLDLVDWAGRGDAAAEARARGKRLGVGLAPFVAICGVGPSTRMSKEGMLGGTWESANVRVHPSGEITLTIGSASTGQSHETTFAQIVAEEFGVDPEAVQVRHSDTERAPYGQGTYGSRSFSVGGAATLLAARAAAEKLRTVAGAMFGVGADEIVLADGKVHPRGAPDTAKTFMEAASAVWYGWDLPAGLQPALDETVHFDPPDFNFPYGAHAAVVEVDEETGEVEVVRYAAVHDIGTVGNPLVVEGQFEGSIAHGLGQALMEEAVFGEDGRLLTDSLASYPLPRARDVPWIDHGGLVTVTPHTALGAKGAGEIATVPVAAAVTNAVCAALGTPHLDMPLTPEKVWRALRAHDEEA